MSADFSYLKGYGRESDGTRNFTMYMLEGEPTLQMLQANEANKAYFNALLALNQTNMRRLKGRKLQVSLLQKSRAQDAVLYSKHVIQGWEGIVDSAGNPVPFSEPAAKEFFLALPSEIFDEIRDWAAGGDDWMPDAPTDEDLEAIAGN